MDRFTLSLFIWVFTGIFPQVVFNSGSARNFLTGAASLGDLALLPVIVGFATAALLVGLACFTCEKHEM